MPEDVTPLHALDEALARVRTAQQRPGYRRRLTEGTGIPGGIAGLRVLRAIERLSADSAPSISDVAARLVVEHSTASRAVDVVVREDLVRRAACEQDQRRARLTLTEHGRAVLRDSTARRVRLLEEVTEGWDDDEIRRLGGMLERLLSGLERVEGGS